MEVGGLAVTMKYPKALSNMALLYSKQAHDLSEYAWVARPVALCKTHSHSHSDRMLL